MWTPARYELAAAGETIPIDEHHQGFVLGGARVLLTEHTTFRRIAGQEVLAYGLPIPDDKGFLFVSEGAAPQTYFAAHFDDPLVLIGPGSPCKGRFGADTVAHGTCEHKTGRVLIRGTKAYAMAADLVVLFDASGEHTRAVSLPSGRPPDKSVPPAEDLLTLESGLSFLRGPDGLFVREPGGEAWKKIGANTVTSLSADESGVVANGSDGPTLLVDNVSFYDPFRRAPLSSKLVPTSSSSAELPEGRADRETALLVTSRTVPYVPDLCRIVSPTHDLLACTDVSRETKFPGAGELTARDRIFRILPLSEERGPDGGRANLPEPLYPGHLPLEPTLPTEWEGEEGSTNALAWNEYGTVLGGLACEGKHARFVACARRGYDWKTVSMSPALETIDPKARLEFLPAANDDIFIFAKEPDGSITIGLAASGRLRRFPKAELPAAVSSAFAEEGNDAGGATDAGAPSNPLLALVRHRGDGPPTPVQRLVTKRNSLRLVGIYTNGKSYSIELSFDGQPQLDTFDGYVSFAGPYGLGIHQHGGLFESLDGAHSFVRVAAPPLRPWREDSGAGNGDDGSFDPSKELHCYPGGCLIGPFERRGYGTLTASSARSDAGRDAR